MESSAAENHQSIALCPRNIHPPNLVCERNEEWQLQHGCVSGVQNWGLHSPNFPQTQASAPAVLVFSPGLAVLRASHQTNPNTTLALP